MAALALHHASASARSTLRSSGVQSICAPSAGQEIIFFILFLLGSLIFTSRDNARCHEVSTMVCDVCDVLRSTLWCVTSSGQRYGVSEWHTQVGSNTTAGILQLDRIVGSGMDNRAADMYEHKQRCRFGSSESVLDEAWNGANEMEEMKHIMTLTTWTTK